MMEIMEVIRSRHSVRQYLNTKIEDEKRNILDSLCAMLNEEAGLNMQIIYDEPKCFNSIMAHYGSFSGVENYIAIVGPKGDDLEEKAGYYGEKLVLKAQELGLNTCWVALTHGKPLAKIGKGEKLSVVISLGYGATQGKEHKSKDINVLAKVSEDDPQWYADGVEAAILAPTAVNQQKFFIDRDEDKVKISAPKGMLTKMDLGIIKCHFEMASGHKAD